MSLSAANGRPKISTAYRYSVVGCGAAAIVYASLTMPRPHLDLRFLLLAVITIVVSSRFAVRIPRANTNVTVSDTFIFLALLVYGGFAGILLAAAEGLFSGIRISKTALVVAFNSAMMACSTFLAVTIIESFFGPVENLRLQNWQHFIPAVGALALAQYFLNTGMSAIGLALKEWDSVFRIWQTHYLWTSIIYISGGTVAATCSSSFDKAGLAILIVSTPVISIVYFTYHKYLDEIKASAEQAERAERERAEAESARAEAERARAEQAERHVQELNRYITEQERISAQLQESKDHFRHAAFHDTLTNLPNRALFAENLKFVIERAKQHEDFQFAVLFLDLDRFKNVNDSLGHSIGDQLLIAMARRLEHCIRETDMVARLGGDEFAILLDGVAHSRETTNMAKRIQQKLESPFNLSGHEVFITTSIGIALSSTGYDHPELMLRDADTAMYRAKAQGKACYEVFHKGMHAHAVYLLQMENDLRRAIDREEFRVHYQPIVSLNTGQLAGFEALVRWEHPERGFVSPGDFISLAEDTGLIVPLGMWVLKRSCAQLSKWQWQSHSTRNLFMSVNLSSKQLAQSALVNQIRDVLRETHVEPRHLKLEITESSVMENAETAVQLLRRLKALGVQLSIDDFGTGYSSLGYLHRFPVDTLKIDRSFIGRIGDTAENNEIVRTIVSLAENMGMEVVAEGVETLAQFSQLRALNVQYGQGYLFSRPADAGTIGGWISRQPEWQASLFPKGEFLAPATGSVMQLRSA